MILLFTLAACVSAPAIHPEDVSFRAVHADLQVPKHMYVLIVSDAGLRRFIDAYGAPVFNERGERMIEPPDVDFKTEWLLGAFWEPQDNACYEIQFRRLQRDSSGVTRALVHHKLPREDEICAQVVTYPQSLIAVPIDQIGEPSRILFEVQGRLIDPQLWE